MFACGGAPVPRVVLERSEEQGIPAARVYGLTELPTVTVMNRSHPFELRAGTDGAVAPGVEVRGGEKFSARDIEDLLMRHPAVRQAALVPGPDARFGEVPVAFVVLAPGSRASEADLAQHLRAAGLARQKTPVAWHFTDALPMTPAGKVKKFELVAAAGARR
jgi:acyl-CoA synthetase (AMP-forming)/AMP-acid ligase II